MRELKKWIPLEEQVVLRELYPEIHKDIWNTHLVDVLKQRSNTINLADYGFPTDWEDILRF